MAKRERRDESFYRGLVDEYRRSGQSQRQFAAERGIPYGTLSTWCHKLKLRDSARALSGGASAPAPTALQARDPAPASAESPFLPVRLLPGLDPGSGSYEVVLARGTVRLPADFDPVRVGALLRALEVVC